MLNTTQKRRMHPLIIVTTFFLSLMVSCASSEARRMQSFEGFVENVETNGANYTAEQWERSLETYEKYVSQFDELSNRYTPEQNRAIGRLKARYHKALFTYYANVTSNYLNNISYQFDGYVDEMTESARDNNSDPRRIVSDLEDEYEESTERIMETVDKLSEIISEME